jgi:hypothetical protein
MNITLVCWSCGKEAHFESNRRPDFGFELMQLASDANWKSYHDPIHGRILVFCTEDCAKSQMTKNGRFRLRPRRRYGKD